MHFSGRYAVDGRPEDLFQKLQDPAILKRCMPGCEELVRTPDGGYDARLQVGLGPIKGTFTGRVVLKDVVPPRGYTLDLKGEGRTGFLRGEARISLEPLLNGTQTEIRCEGDVQVGGLLASVGARLMPGAARSFSEQFFQALEEALRGSKDLP